jgi:hypothetical protein
MIAIAPALIGAMAGRPDPDEAEPLPRDFDRIADEMRRVPSGAEGGRIRAISEGRGRITSQGTWRDIGLGPGLWPGVRGDGQPARGRLPGALDAADREDALKPPPGAGRRLLREPMSRFAGLAQS